jgi:N-acetylglucosamine-6-sulfatase
MLLVVVVLTAHASQVAAAAESKPRRPNILFVFSDDHAVNAVSAYGGPLAQIAPTPNMDRLAQGGAIFRNAFCGNSICGPSRATILTGKHSHKNGFLTHKSGPFDGSQFTFPKRLQSAGYETALVGKWHLKSTPTGFDHWEILPGQGHYYNPEFLTTGGEPDNPQRTRQEGYCTDLITDKAIDWLEQRDKQKPFLLMCHHKAPHRTWAPPLRYLDRYADVDIPEPETLFDDYKNRSASLATNRMSISEHFYYAYDLKVQSEVPFATPRERQLQDGEYRRMTPNQREAWDAAFGPRNRAFLATKPTGNDLVRWKYQRYIKNYLRCVAAVDDSVGRLLDYLETSDLQEDTIVIYSSDQGFYLGEHGWYDKRWMFEESLKMPLIMRWPGVTPAGAHREELVQNIDYAPTFLDAAGMIIPEEIQGESLRRLFTSDEPKWRDAIYYHYYEGGGEHNVPRHEGVRTARYKLVHFYDRDEFNLFDLEKDPDEMHSLHADRQHSVVLTELKALLKHMRSEYEPVSLRDTKVTCF